MVVLEEADPQTLQEKSRLALHGGDSLAEHGYLNRWFFGNRGMSIALTGALTRAVELITVPPRDSGATMPFVMSRSTCVSTIRPSIILQTCPDLGLPQTPQA